MLEESGTTLVPEMKVSKRKTNDATHGCYYAKSDSHAKALQWYDHWQFDVTLRHCVLRVCVCCSRDRLTWQRGNVAL